MERVKRIDRPHCHSPLTSMRGIRVGGKTTCNRCRTSFVVRSDDVPDAAGSIRPGRATLVFFAMLLYLGGGASLGIYCWTEQQKELPDAVASDGMAAPKQGEPAPEQPLAANPNAPKKPRTISVAELRKIDKAIADGCWFLREHVQPGGSWSSDGLAVAYAALPALTLLECGVPCPANRCRRECGEVRCARWSRPISPRPHISARWRSCFSPGSATNATGRSSSGSPSTWSPA